MSVRVFPGLLTSLIVLSLVGCKDPDDGHGYTPVQLTTPMMASDADIYIGTSRIRVKLDYSPCLADWYTNNPDYVYNGIEGTAIFEDWKQELCSVDLEGGGVLADCTVESVMNSPSQLTVNYTINDSQLAARVLPFGPIPCERLANCPSPTVTALAADAVQGYVGTEIAWEGQASQPAGGCDQGAAIQIRPVPR